MTTINDRQLRSTYSALETQFRADPNTKVDGNGMVKLLAAVADTWWSGQASLEKSLSKPGITRAEQLALVKNGMGSTEKADLIRILDKGAVPLTDEVKSFLEQVVDRAAPPAPTDGALRITGNQAGGLIKGTLAAGSTVEALNLSTAPNARLTAEDTFVLGKAGADGKFQGSVPDMKEGDLIKMRSRDAAGKAGDWVTVRASGLGTDTRNAEVAIFRIGLTDEKNGKISLENINASRQVSEPGAKLMFINERTSEKTTITMDANGTFPADTKLNGKAGDSFSVRASDGTNNKDFSAEVGKVQVPGGTGGTGGGVQLPDPKLHKDEMNADGTPKFSTKRFTGPLYTDGLAATDVKQGQIGNCYMPAGVASVAHVMPEVIKEMIKDNGNGSYTVTFKEEDYRNGGYKNKEITVDADLYVRSYGGPLYGSSSGSTSPDKMEMWWPVLEKAFAQWKGSFNAIGNGGVASEVIEAIVGRPNADLSIRYSDETKVWNKIKTSVDNKMPVAAGTYGKDEASRYTNTGVHSNHAYSILGYEERGGEKYVNIRNPWGETEPWPGDGKNDGIFALKLKDFMKLYQTVYTVR